MSRNKTTTKSPVLPALPIEIWFTAWPDETWYLVEDQDDCILQFSQVRRRANKHYRRFRGTEYLEGLLAIDGPQQLIQFINTYACPEDIVSENVQGGPDKGAAPFRWRTFAEAQDKLRQAMVLEKPRLLRRAELARFLKLETFTVTAEKRDGIYYGTITKVPSLEACYQVIAFQRLIGNVTYGFCERCGKHFTVTSGHKRKYCDTAICGHAVASQRYRDRQKRKRLDENK